MEALRMTLRDPDITAIARIFADRARATILLSLLDGIGHDATDLAARARVTPSTASAHLKTLLAAHLVRVERQGKHRIYSLAGPQVRRAAEALASIAPDARVTNPSLTRSVRLRRFAEARQCYDHLGGRLAVALASDLQAKHVLKPVDGGFLLRANANTALRLWGIDLEAILDGSPFVRECPDWSEGGVHLGGPLAVALCRRLESLGAIALHPKQRYFDQRWPLKRVISLTVKMTAC
jgi:DNA-binding transcriptional ArsR family regulator